MSAAGEIPKRAWQRMLSGRRLDLLQPAPEDIDIGDIAHGLARVARWNGQTRGDHAFSVAQHSLLVLDVFSRLNARATLKERRAALLHDAPEYVIGDLISPFKAAIGLDYKSFERRLLGAIHRRFDVPEILPETLSRQIKLADQVAAYYEATRLAGFSEAEAIQFFGDPAVLPLEEPLSAIEPWPADRAEASFLERFIALAHS